MDKLKIKQAVIVEGRYDKIALENVIDAVIIPVNGFGVYKDGAKLELIRKYAQTTGVVILTDSDGAGMQIRNYLKGCLTACEVYNVYAPPLLEVEETDADDLRNAFIKAGICGYTTERGLGRSAGGGVSDSAAERGLGQLTDEAAGGLELQVKSGELSLDIFRNPNALETGDLSAAAHRLEPLSAELDYPLSGGAITRERLFDDGLIGLKDSAAKRARLLKHLSLPDNLSTTALIDALRLFPLDEYEKFVNSD